MLSRICIILAIVSFGQFSFGMNLRCPKSPAFTHFSELESGIQNIIMNSSDNYANIQKTNKYWYSKKTIKSKDAILTYFCNMSNERKVQIALNAVYTQNNVGVKNILQHGVMATSVQSPLFHEIKTNIDGTKLVLDLYGIAQHNKDTIMLSLLDEYKVSKITSQEITCPPTRLIMACLAGNSGDIIQCSDELMEEMKKALKVAINYDHSKCMQVIINNLLDDSNVIDMIMHFTQINQLLERTLLEYACNVKKAKALQVLLASQCFNLNTISNGQTLLDTILKLAEDNSEYKEVIHLLEMYGAKTLAKLESDTQDADDSVRKLSFMACTIS
jgi:hypothetical protein